MWHHAMKDHIEILFMTEEQLIRWLKETHKIDLQFYHKERSCPKGQLLLFLIAIIKTEVRNF
jgi:hypothetical protein